MEMTVQYSGGLHAAWLLNVCIVCVCVCMWQHAHVSVCLCMQSRAVERVCYLVVIFGNISLFFRLIN